jgi:tRNA dimethylallyltransferase
MNPPEERSTLVAIVGPTASGKSALGVWLATRIGGEVVSCDSTQLYRGFDIGTAKPTMAERGAVPHHLLDVLEAHEASTAGGYRERAVAVLHDLRERSRVPVLTVGTGLYLKALLEGLAEVPQRSEELRERLRAAVQEHKPGHLHRILKRLDHEAAAKIAAADEQKVIRAIEVCILAKKPLSEVHKAGRVPLPGWRPVKIALHPPRTELYERIQSRTDAMLERGWLDEVRGLMAQPRSENAKAFDFIGYRELRAVLRNEMQLTDARAAIQQATRRYAKRQLTWFRRETGVHWLTGFGDAPAVQEEALAFLRQEGLAETRGARRTSV